MERAKTQLYRTVRAYAAENGTTVGEVSKAVGCDYQVFNRRLKGVSAFKFGEAYRLANILNISMEELYQLAPDINRC